MVSNTKPSVSVDIDIGSLRPTTIIINKHKPVITQFVVGAMYITLVILRSGLLPVYATIGIAGVILGLVSWVCYVLFVRSARSESGHRIQLVYTLLVFTALTALYQLVFGANIQTVTHTFSEVHILSGYLNSAQIAAIVLALAIPALLYFVARYTMIGKFAYAASRYPLGARSIGVRVDRIYMSVFILAGVLAGIAGGVLMTFQPVQPALGLQYTVVIFLVALVARTHFLGCVAVGFAYGIAQLVFSYEINSAAASTLVLVIFFVPLLGQRPIRWVRGLLRRQDYGRGEKEAVAELVSQLDREQ